MKYDFYITGTIGVAYDWWTGQRGTTVSDVKRFLAENKDKELNIAVSSPGGYLSEGITIGELISAHGKCNMIIVGMTASVATVLCMKAKSVKIAKGSLMLIHNSSYMLDVWKSANKNDIDAVIDALKKDRDDLDTFDRAIASIYSSRNGKSIEDNLVMMDKEKWMLDTEAVEFGIADSILDDDEAAGQAKAVKNSCAAMDGFAGRYGLPDIPIDAQEQRGFLQRMREHLSGILNSIGSQKDEHSFINTKNMKSIILNCICAILALKDIAISDKGEATLTEDQLKALDKAFKSKEEEITTLQNEKKTAVDEKEKAVKAQQDAEEKLRNLQKEFDDFKAEAGDGTDPIHTKGTPEPSAKDLLNDVRNLL